MEMRTIKRIDPASAAKVGAIVGLAVGVLVGLIMTLFGGLGMLGALSEGDVGAGMLSLFFGGGALVAMPIFYAVLEAIGFGIGALVYNLASRLMGGIQVEIE